MRVSNLAATFVPMKLLKCLQVEPHTKHILHQSNLHKTRLWIPMVTSCFLRTGQQLIHQSKIAKNAMYHRGDLD